MARFSLNIALSSLLVSAMMFASSPAMAQRNHRNENRSESHRSENRSAERHNRNESRNSNRSSERQNRPDNRNEAHNWPKINRGSQNNNRGYQDRNHSFRNDRNDHKDKAHNNGVRHDNRNDRNHNKGFHFDRPNRGHNNGHAQVHRPGHNSYAHDHHGVVRHRPASWFTPVAPPHRSYRPVHHRILRPVPPRGYRPWRNAPIISGILGLSFGCSYHHSLDYLFNRGYEIDGYYNGIVYLRNIEEMKYFWPDAMLNYTSGNSLSSAEFHYSTAYDDLGRFNRLYRDLCHKYGEPVTYQETSSGIQSIWYGGNAKGYVTLEYFYNNSRYYTTLAYGY